MNNGPCELRFETGELMETRTYVNGEITGDVTRYYRNGQVEMTFPAVNGMFHDGVCCEYYANGQLKSERFKLNGKRHGLYRTFFKNGAPEKVAFFKNDKLHGEYIERNHYNDDTFHCFYMRGHDRPLSEYIRDINAVTADELIAIRNLFNENYFTGK